MSHKYSCKGCNYSTNNKALYEQHKNTKKHNKLSEEKEPNKTCLECNKTFSTTSNFYKHKNKYHKTINKQINQPVEEDTSNLLLENIKLKEKLALCEEELKNAQKKIIELYDKLVNKN